MYQSLQERQDIRLKPVIVWSAMLSGRTGIIYALLQRELISGILYLTALNCMENTCHRYKRKDRSILPEICKERRVLCIITTGTSG